MSGGGRLARVAAVSALVIGGGSMLVGLGRPTVPAAAAQPATALAALAADLDQRLGLPAPAGRRSERLVDAARGKPVDEVTDLAGDGTPIAVSRFDLDGGLVSSVRLGLTPAALSPIPPAQATASATALVARLAIPAGGTPLTTPRSSGGWLVRWVRVAGGVPVPGDGVSIQLTAAGQFHAVVRTSHRLAPRPPVAIDEAVARGLAGSRLDHWLGPDLRPDATIAGLALAWVAPNDTFGDPIPAGSAGLLHLAWIARVTTSGVLADRVAGLELAFDAGDGAPLGGDLLE